MVLFSATTVTNAQNLVPNGDFEEWDYWTGNPDQWSPSLASPIEKSNESQSGDYSATLNTDDFSNYVAYMQTKAKDITLEKGKTYEISFYYWLKKGTLTKFNVMASYSKSGEIFPQTLFSGDVELPSNQDTWKKFTMTHDELNGTTLSLFQILIWSEGDASLLIDNVVIRDQAGASIGESDVQDAQVYFNKAGELVVEGIDNVDSVRIYSLDGKLVSTDPALLASGTYVAVVKGDGLILSKKVVKL